jgi:PucR-like helix-turn-helix protein
LRVRVEVEVTLFLLRVAPRDREHLLALSHVVLDHAPPGGEVQHVVLVDRRGDEQQRSLSHLIGRGLVLDQLEHVRAEHDRPGGDRDVAADLELADVDRRRQPRRGVQIVDEMTGAADEVAAAGIDHLLDHGRIGPGEVGRGQRVEHVPDREPRAPLGAPVDLGVGDQPVDGLADRQVTLEQPPEQPAALPGGVREPPVSLGGHELGAAGRRRRRAQRPAHLRASIETLESDRDVTREDLLFVRPHAARRAKRVSITEFVQAFYVGERVLWDTALALAHDDESRRAALVFASHLPRYFEVATTPAAEVYLETQEQLAATGERIRRDLLEDLLAGAGLPLAVAVSTTVTGLAQIPDAYRESSAIRIARGSRPGVIALSELSAFEYLTLRPDATASRLIPRAVHEFVAQDMAEGGPLIATLREYVACDLNARRAAENLHIHVNTAHYRLSRIAERTGYDLRLVSDLIEILIAARLADAGLVAPHNRGRPN